MKTILFAIVAAAATLVAPLHAATPQKFTVKNVTITTLDGKIPPGAPVFKKGAVLDITIAKKQFKAPKQIVLPVLPNDPNIYRKGTGVLSYTEATIHRNIDNKVIGVDLNCFRPVKVGSASAPGMVSYTLIPKK